MSQSNHQIAGSPVAVPAWLEARGWLLVVAFILVMPFHNLFELPMLLMALLGLWLLATQPRQVMGLPAVRLLFVMAACFWIPMLASLCDAVNLKRSASTALTFLRFPLAGIFVIVALQDARNRARLLAGLVIGLSITAVCVILQGLQESLLHLPEPIFQAIRVFSGQHAVGHLLAALSPLCLYWGWRHARQWPWVWAGMGLYVMAIIFVGARVAWIMLLVGLLALAVQLVFIEKIRVRWKMVAVVTLLGMALLGLASRQPFLHQRFTLTAGLFSGDYTQVNNATSARLPIWKVAEKVIHDHWINGVGPRGFRHLYIQYAEKDDIFLAANPGIPPTHPHQMLLEIMAETGVIGLLGYLLALGCWWKLAVRAVQERKFQSLPALTAVLIAMLPINAHMAFYASFWSSITWWLVALALAFWQWDQARS